MKVLLINPISTESPFSPKKIRIPYGLAYIGAVLEKEGCAVSIWDRNIRKSNTREMIVRHNPDIIGFTVMTGKCIIDALTISNEIKSISPNLPIVWGGYHPTLLPEQTLKEKSIDFIVYGEGEYTLLDLCRTLEKNKPVKKVLGIYYKKNGEILRTPPRSPIQNLDDLPFPAWHLFDVKKYIWRTTWGNELNLNTSRGCPFHCAFCCEPAFHKRRWRSNSPKRVLRMIQYLKAEYNIKHVAIKDSLFTANLKRIEQICDGLIKEKTKIYWHCPARITNWNRNLLKKMKKSGCMSFELGFESGVPRLLKMMNKNITLSEAHDTFLKCKEVGILAVINTIIGLPTETRKELYQTLRFLGKYPENHISVNIYMPLPSTVLYDFLIRNGLFKPPQTLVEWGKIDNPFSEVMPAFGEVPKRELWEIVQRIRKRNEAIGRKIAMKRIVKNPLNFLERIRR